MFKEKNDETYDRTGELNTIIGKGAKFEGNIEVDHGIRIDGMLKGSVKSSDSIVLGKEGIVDGEIYVKSAIIGGKITGKIQATGKVVLEASAVVNGDLKTSKLVINEGAVFDGACVMKSDKSAPLKTAVKPAPEKTKEATSQTTSKDETKL